MAVAVMHVCRCSCERHGQGRSLVELMAAVTEAIEMGQGPQVAAHKMAMAGPCLPYRGRTTARGWLGSCQLWCTSAAGESHPAGIIELTCAPLPSTPCSISVPCPRRGPLLLSGLVVSSLSAIFIVSAVDLWDAYHDKSSSSGGSNGLADGRVGAAVLGLPQALSAPLMLSRLPAQA